MPAAEQAFQPRDRIIGFKRVKASQLIPNKDNWRLHNEAQRSTLRDLLTEVGIADALIVRQLPKGKLEVIDGHLRQDTDPNIEWPVLILDVTAAEAKKLLLSLDPLAAMATADLEKLDRLRQQIASDSPNLQAMWDQQMIDAQRMVDLNAGTAGGSALDPAEAKKLADRFLISPFSVLSARDGWWQERKRAWIALGIQSELGRGGATPPGGSLMPAMK